jgi:aldehyde dehydrogenase (NAD+)
VTPIESIPTIVEQIREGFRAGAVHSLDERRIVLGQLRRFLVEQEPAIVEALTADLGKSPTEAYTTEIGFTIAEIDHALRHLSSWNRRRKVRVPLTLKPGSAMLVPQPVGTVLVVAPWNYPLQLLLAPLVPAIAAGNTVVLKPSEVSAATASLVERMLPHYLDHRAVGVVTGGVDETTALLRERFDHIFYTGNGNVGRIVMRAAAEHLTPVTLELGGKSPAIVAADADIEVSARRIAWGKFVNAGQTCVAPDYVLVDDRIETQFVAALGRAVERFFGDDPQTSPDYGRIINDHHHDRLTGLLAAGGFAATPVGGQTDRTDRFIAPTVVTGVEPDAALMDEEIFGPLLPVLTVSDLDEAIDFVNDRPKPLALYVFTGDDAIARRVVKLTSSGGVTVNHTLLHLALADLPFGGVGESGIGAYHGQAGFDLFTHHKPVLTKRVKPDLSVMYPPYGRFKQKILRRAL